MQHDIDDLASLINAMQIKITLLQQRAQFLDHDTKQHIIEDIRFMATQLANDGKH